MIDIDINVRCEDCGDTFVGDEDFYCSKCFSSLEAQIEDLNNRIGDLLSEIEDLKGGSNE